MAPITIATFCEPLEAQMFAGLLSSAGIKAWIADQHMIGMQWTLSTALGGVKVQVVPNDADTALRIRRDYDHFAFTSPSDDTSLSATAAPRNRSLPWLALLLGCWLVANIVFPLPPRHGAGTKTESK